jgi:ABC-type ATPase with predicted acetyltransferase domain
MRVDIARALLLEKDRIVFDEFTSVIDREVARMACIAISKGVRKSEKQLIVVTCHRDVVDWLEPDWVLDTDNMVFNKKKEPDSHLNSKSVGLTLTFGECLGSITI